MDRDQVLQALMKLRTSRDLDALNSVLLDLFDPSGPLKSFSVYFNSAKKSGFCILEMVSPMSRSDAAAAGALGLGNILCLEFSMPRNEGEAKNGPQERRPPVH